MSLADRLTGSAVALAVRGTERAVVARLHRARRGSLDLELLGGRRARVQGADPGPDAHVRVLSPSVYTRIGLHGEIGLGEAYMDMAWESDDLPTLLEWGARNRRALALDSPWLTRPARLWNRRRHLQRRNSRERARSNIAQHYDLGNDFFRLFLDESMTYSSAVFAHEEQPLGEAQENKYRRICEKAGIGPQDRVLEVGSGWGGFAAYAARTYGCTVTSITISEAQLAGARERIGGAGLAESVDFRLLDYRDLPREFPAGAFDKVVSIEMFEAVGAEYFARFFEACEAVAAQHARFVLQTIAVPDRTYHALRTGSNWMQKYIFPGGMLPSLAAIDEALRNTRWVIAGVEDIAPHYARTLACWRRRFLAHRGEVLAQGFDDRFCRMWDYFLAISEAGFRTRETADYQVVLDRLD